MDFSSLQNATEQDKAALGKVAETIRKERATSRIYKNRIDNLALSYQQQIAALKKELQHLKQSGQSVQTSLIESKVKEAEESLKEKLNGQIAVLEEDVSTIREDLRKAETENNGKEQELCGIRQTAAADASIILQLREEVTQLRESKERVTLESVGKHARNMQLLRESHETESKVIKFEQSNAFLRSEVMRLSQEMAMAKTNTDSSRAAHEAAVTAANKLNTELSSDLAKSNIRGQQLATRLADIERHVIDLQEDFDRERADQRAEIDSFVKQVELHREEAKDAKIQLAGCTELLGTLAKEKAEVDDRPADTPILMDRHAEVLFKDLNNALDSKLLVLEKERHELTRARAKEARMATKQQALIREADTARRELEQTRNGMITLEAELNVQKDKVVELERKLLYASSEEMQQSSPMNPLGRSAARKSFGSNFAAPGSKRRRSIVTPSPFRRSGGLGVAEQELAGVTEIRQRHEALLQSIKQRRDDYAERMHE